MSRKLCRSHCEQVSGRILIDHFGYCKHHEGLKRNEIKDPNSQDQDQCNKKSRKNNRGQDQNDQSAEDDSEKNYIRRLSLEKQEANKKAMLANEQDLIFMSPILTGFSLKVKLWLSFYVDDIRPLNWNDEAYSHLVYPEEQKDLVLTFVENHKRLKAKGSGVDDVIYGKGQGLILLLSGPPGTGKTLTAEAVADKTRRPLYYLQAEELGTNAATLGPKIKKVFEMATEWDAVILLDEADVFMAERSPADIVRNELVSIFLRELEYFQGIIFLTTNLYSTIDTAFRSRVNIHLLFSPLPAASRLVLWRKFLSRLPPRTANGDVFESALDHLSESDMQQLALWELNGREIKNAIKTVRTWCLLKDYDMSLSRLESGIRVTAPQAVKGKLTIQN
jgi:ATPase family associated with various cellular activities (AAA)